MYEKRVFSAHRTSGRPWTVRKLAAHWECHIFASPASLRFEITAKVDVLIAEPAIAVLILEKLHGTSWFVSIGVGFASVFF